MDSDRQYELSTFGEPPSRTDHPTPLLPLLYARHYWRRAARRFHRRLLPYGPLDYVAEYPSWDGEDTILLTGPTTPGKSLVDVVQGASADAKESPQPRSFPGSVWARYQLERASDATRQRVGALRNNARSVARTVVDAIRAGPFGGDHE